MRVRDWFAAVLLVTLTFLGHASAETATITVDAGRPGPKIPPTLYGLFFEEINRAGDGGLYAELIQNRSFEDDPKEPAAWRLVGEAAASAKLSLDALRPLNEHNPRALRVDVPADAVGKVGVANSGYGGIAVRKGAKYRLSFHSRSDANGAGLEVSLQKPDGHALSSPRPVEVTRDWRRVEAEVEALFDADDARLVLAPRGASGSSFIDVVSLFPVDTFKNRTNGMRRDLAEMLASLEPAFLRFPGGCFVEGETMATAWRWKETIGDVAARPGRPNLWGYRSTDGLGYHEYLQMAEDLGAAAMFVVNCGMSHKESVPMDQFGPYVQDALDAIEYAVGPADSRWGSLRAKAGHPEPFDLKYIEIGNENGGHAYDERYAAFYDAISRRYPDITIIAGEWGGHPKSRPIPVLDEHYYNTPEFFIAQANRYDAYARDAFKVYVGEYAVTRGCGEGNLRAAVGEAAFMTGFERNADVVVMASYAPLLARPDAKKWNPDLIYFDNTRAFGTPSFHVQRMFARNIGDVALQTDVTWPEPPGRSGTPRGKVGLATWKTSAEFKDLEVRDNDVLHPASHTLSSRAAWDATAGDWELRDGTHRQSALAEDQRIVYRTATGATSIQLKARKRAGDEGFLVMFNVQDDQNFTWLNLGGWGNSRHAIEHCVNGGKSTVGPSVPGKIETNRWYDVRIELDGRKIRCHLDGEKLIDTEYPRLAPLHVTASRKSADELIVKVVNVTADPRETTIDFRGAGVLAPTGTVDTLTSDRPEDENSFDEPMKVAPKREDLTGISGTALTRTFPGNSVSVLRVRTNRE